MQPKVISRELIKQLVEEKLTAMGMLKDHEEVSIKGDISVEVKEKEEVYTVITHGEESFKKLYKRE